MKQLPEWKKARDIRIMNGEQHTNFGWLTQELIDKGIEWGAVKWGYKEHGILNVCRDKGKKSFNTWSCWLAFIDRSRGVYDWYKHLERVGKPGEGTIDDIEVKKMFKALTGISVPLEGKPMWSTQPLAV